MVSLLAHFVAAGMTPVVILQVMLVNAFLLISLWKGLGAKCLRPAYFFSPLHV
jgi:hypothetical protein